MMPKGHTPIGPGEYQPVTKGTNAAAQFAYLQVVAKLKPEVLTELAVIAHDVTRDSSETWFGRIATLDGSAIRDWADRHNMNDHWLLEIAALTVNEWRAFPAVSLADQRQWTSLASGGPEPEWPTFTWNPLTTTRGAAELSMRSYLDDVEALASRSGFERTQNRRDPSALEWLVRFQVCQESKLAIVAGARGKRRLQDHKSETDDLSRKLRDMAALVGITLRKEPPGPKAKRTDVRHDSGTGRQLLT